MAFFETFFFAINLYSTNLKLINQDDYVQNEMINEAMDGSIRKDKKIDHKFTTIIRKKTMNAPIKKIMNPIRDGLSLVVIQILRVSLVHIYTNHIKMCIQNNVSSKDRMFVPVNHVINDMFRKLLISENINALILGSSYKKSHEYFKSEDFRQLISGIVSNEIKNFSTQHSRLDSQDGYFNERINENDMFEDEKDGGEESDEFNYVPENHEINLDEPSLTQYWETKLIEFLTKSNESWILDQYKLIKHFLLQNSIDSHITEFKHPIFNHYDNITTLKDRYNTMRRNTSYRSHIRSKSDKMDEGFADDSASENLNNSSTFIEEAKPSPTRLSFKKLDISALIQTIEEIENRLKMQYILNRSSIFSGI